MDKQRYVIKLLEFDEPWCYVGINHGRILNTSARLACSVTARDLVTTRLMRYLRRIDFELIPIESLEHHPFCRYVDGEYMFIYR